MQLPPINPQEYQARLEREFDEAMEERRKKRIEETILQQEKRGLNVKAGGRVTWAKEEENELENE